MTGNKELSPQEIKRYSRHLTLPQVGIQGQQRLKAARILLIGVGGLGSPIAMYLAAAGVGHIGLVDFDVVDFSNLQRQIIHFSNDVGKSKLESATDKIAALNPDIEVTNYNTRLTAANAEEICQNYDILIDGSDNFPTRYLVNDVSVLLKKPYVYGSIFRFEGQISVFDSEHGPCYRCLYPSPPAPGKVPNCAAGGVLGVLPGIVGVIQATETIKLILDEGDSLRGRLLLVDALAMNFRELKIKKNYDCPICGENPTIFSLKQENDFCPAPQDLIPKITPKELQRRLQQQQPLLLIDVREPHEYDICHIPQAMLIPLKQLNSRLGELDKDVDIVVHCYSGQRSQKAVAILQQQGYYNIKNLEGGILAWADQIDPSIPKY